jgi:putative oxidoreductase
MDIDKTLRDTALLAARLTLGGSLAMHGAQKMFGIQDGPGLGGTAQMMNNLGFKPGEKFAPVVAATEMSAGTMIALGALGPIGPAMLLSTMLVAIETVHRPKGYWNQGGGYEMNAMYIMLALVLANEGFGAISLDEMFGFTEKLRPVHGWISLVGGVAAALLILGQRNTEQPQSKQTDTASQDGASSRDEVGAGV